MMRKITLPGWFVNLPDDAWLNSAEIRKVFGYSRKTHTSELIRRGSLPEVDELKNGLTVTKNMWRISKKNMWRVLTIRNFIKNKCEY